MEVLPTKIQLSENPNQVPEFHKVISKDVKVCCPKAIRALISLMDMEAVIGGAASHFGGPSAFAEIYTSVFGLCFEAGKKENKNWYELFNVVNDAGHCENAIYAIKAMYKFADLNFEKLRTFRALGSELTGHGEVHMFPKGVLLSNGPLGSSLPQAQGLAMGDQLSKKNRVTLVTLSDGAFMEGEAKEALSAIPGLASKEKLAPFVCILSDNNTKLSGRISEQSFDLSKNIFSLRETGWHFMNLEEGHDLEKVYSAISEAVDKARANPKTPVFLRVKTIKGFGTKKTANSSSGAHGFPLSKSADLSAFLQEIYGSEEVPKVFSDWVSSLVQKQELKNSNSSSTNVFKEKVQVGVAAAMVEMKEKGFPIVSVTSDLPGSTGVQGFRNKFPESCFDVGVAESNMVSSAAGLSKLGYIPFVDTFAQFGATKGALPLIMSQLSEAPVFAIFSHTGFQDAADGASHQSVSYLSMLSSIPNVKTIVLSSSSDAKILISQAIEEFSDSRKNNKVPSSYVFFLGREKFVPELVSPSKIKLGKAQVISSDTEKFNKIVTIAVSGPLISQAIKAKEDLKSKKIGLIIVNPSIINFPDVETFSSCLEKSHGRLVTLEDHRIVGGMGSILSHALSLSGIDLKLRSLGIGNVFGQSSYTAIELYKKHNMDSKAIVDACVSLFDS